MGQIRTSVRLWNRDRRRKLGPSPVSTGSDDKKPPGNSGKSHECQKGR